MGLRETLEAATPGPWEACTDGMFPVVTKPESYATVMEFSVYGKDGRPEAEANAHLVALTPELAAEVLELRERHREAMALVLDMGEALDRYYSFAPHMAGCGFSANYDEDCDCGRDELDVLHDALLARLDQIGKEQT